MRVTNAGAAVVMWCQGCEVGGRRREDAGEKGDSLAWRQLLGPGDPALLR